MGQIIGESMAKPFDLLLGRKTYEIFAAHWAYSNEPGAEQLNQARKYVHMISFALTGPFRAGEHHDRCLRLYPRYLAARRDVLALILADGQRAGGCSLAGN